MKQINKSIWFMLTNSIVSITLVISIMVFFMVFHLLVLTDQEVNLKAIIGAITISMTMAVFLGVYFGGALNQLKQNYLWNISKKYRFSLMIAFLICLAFFNLLQMPILYINLKHMPLVLIMPFCVSIFSAYLVLGKNIFYKIIIPAIPLIITQSYRFNFSFNLIFWMIIISTLILVVFMFIGRYQSSQVGVKTESQKALDSASVATTGLNTKAIAKFNSFIGGFIAHSISSKKKNIDWAIIMPHNKLTIFSIMYVFLIVAMVLFISKEGKNMLEAFTILFLATSLISILMESRLLLRQTRTIAHVFNGNNHRQLRNKILFSLDKNFVINFSVFIIGIFIMSSLFSIHINMLLMLMSSVVILLCVLAYYPLLLCFQWINISFSLVVAVSIYAATVFFTLRWLKQSVEDSNLMVYFSALIFCAFIIRFITQKLFNRHPFELLLKNK